MSDTQDGYDIGSRQAWMDVLMTAMRHLMALDGLTQEQVDLVSLIVERYAAINALRRICEEHGDNDWDADLNLADILTKHLERHLGYLEEPHQ